MKTIKSSSLLIILFFCSCSTEKVNDRPGPVIELQGEALKCDCDLFGTFMEAFIDSLILLDPPNANKDSLIFVYQIKGDSIICKPKLVQMGQGPLDALFLRIEYDEENKRLFGFDVAAQLKKMFVINTKSMQDLYDMQKWERKEFDYNEVKYYYEGHGSVCINDTLMLMLAGIRGEPYIMSLLNINTMSFTPLKIEIEDNRFKKPSSKQQIYLDNTSDLYKNSKTGQFLYVCGMSRYLESFRLDSNYNIYDRKVFEFSIYPYAEKSLSHHVEIAITDDYIYTKRSQYDDEIDPSLQNYKGYPVDYNDYIDIYDWDGHYIKSYYLDTPFFDLIIDKKTNTLYVNSLDLVTDAGIVKRYTLE